MVTPVALAAMTGEPRFIRDLLLEYGGDLDLRLGVGPTARQIAVADERKRVLKWMASLE